MPPGRDDHKDEGFEKPRLDTAAMQREFEEGSAVLGDSLPGLWRRLYENSITLGFSEAEALGLTKAYILSQCPHGIRGTDG